MPNVATRAEGFAVEGAARVRLDAQPVFSKEYRSFVKVREEKENVKTRELKRIDNNETDIKRPRPSLLKVRSSLPLLAAAYLAFHTHARWWLVAGGLAGGAAEEEGGPGAGQDDPDAATGAHRAHLLLLPATGALVAHGAARVHPAARGLPQGGAQRGLHLQQEGTHPARAASS